MPNLTSINGETLKKLLAAGYKNLSLHFKAINDLNVFPVPDGDTGTNMKITYFNGMKAIEEATTPGDIIEKFANGMLFGARGNSGVLTSQYFRGVANTLTQDINKLMQLLLILLKERSLLLPEKESNLF